MLKNMVISLILLLLFIGFSFSGSFVVDSKSEFDNGNYFNTTYNLTTSSLTYSLRTTQAYYESQIFDAGTIVNWTNITWIGFPSGKIIINKNESGYYKGNLNISDIVSILHLDEPAGSTSFFDSATNSYRFTCSPPGCPSSSSGIFRNALSFDDGNDDYVSGLIGSLTVPYTITTWVYFSHPIQPSGNYDYVLSISQTSPDDYYNNHVSISRYQTTNRFYDVSLYSSNGLLFGVPLNGTEWQHITLVFQNQSPYLRLYVDGVEQVVDSPVSSVNISNAKLTIGRWELAYHELFGYVDEIAIWNRQLSNSEIYNLYRRGATKVKFQVRSCDDPACVGEQFVGPDGTPSTYYYDDGYSDNPSPKVFNLSVNDSQYFQFRIYYESLKDNVSPEINSVIINYLPFYQLNLTILYPSNNSIVSNGDIFKFYVLDDSSNSILSLYIDGNFIANITNITNDSIVNYQLGNLSEGIHYLFASLSSPFGVVNKSLIFGVSNKADSQTSVKREVRGGGTQIITKTIETQPTIVSPSDEKSSDKVEVRTVEYYIKENTSNEVLQDYVRKKEREIENLYALIYLLTTFIVILLVIILWMYLYKIRNRN